MNRPIHKALLLFFFCAGPAACGALDRGATISRSDDAPVLAAFPADSGDLEKLAKLWQERSQDHTTSDFPIGPGDIVEISVPAMEELRARTVRVAGDGGFTLPFLGKVQVAGLTGEDLEKHLGERLQKYMYHPRVTVFVREYRSRQVAVLGSVAKPGLYTLNNSSETLLDVLTQAGGITPGADPKVYLIPSDSADRPNLELLSSLTSAALQPHKDILPRRADPILIDVKQLAFGGSQHFLSIAARPGDIIMVPGGGQVLVEGWVEKPGAYPVSPGLTVAGVVVQAGGPMYPANVNSVRVIRSERTGGKTTVVTDLAKIKRGESPDIPLQGGDIVEVSYESGKLVAYGFYRFLAETIHFGINGQIPVFK